MKKKQQSDWLAELLKPASLIAMIDLTVGTLFWILGTTSVAQTLFGNPNLLEYLMACGLEILVSMLQLTFFDQFVGVITTIQTTYASQTIDLANKVKQIAKNVIYILSILGLFAIEMFFNVGPIYNIVLNAANTDSGSYVKLLATEYFPVLGSEFTIHTVQHMITIILSVAAVGGPEFFYSHAGRVLRGNILPENPTQNNQTF